MMSEVLSHLMVHRATRFSSPMLGVITFDGKWVFVGAMGLVLVWLLVMPRSLIGQGKATPPWWRNVRVWAIVICVVQMWIYWRFG